MGTSVNVSQIGLDVHRKFSKVTARGSDGKVAWRQRLEHCDRVRLREQLERWPQGTPVVLEGTFLRRAPGGRRPRYNATRRQV